MSTRGSVEGANDNEALTLRSIERDDADQRVYNFAVQSLPGEVTHNYLVGDAEWWTHNTFTGGAFWDSLKKWKKGSRISADGKYIYYPDHLHDNLECFKKKGRARGSHVGGFSAKTGEQSGGKPGRRDPDRIRPDGM